MKNRCHRAAGPLPRYAKVGARLPGFSVDSKFSNALDGLIMVDLRKTDSSLLERYMGKKHAGGLLKPAMSATACAGVRGAGSRSLTVTVR